MSAQLVISNHGPTISGEPRLCRLCGEAWPCENEALGLLRDDERKAVEIHRRLPGSVHACPPWVAERLSETREVLEEALRLGKVGFHQMKALWMHDKMLVRHWHEAYIEAQGKLEAVMNYIRTKITGEPIDWGLLDRILRSKEDE